jgi:tetratricopeptide (TPR) repeat protein
MKKIILIILLALSVNSIAPGFCSNPQVKQLHQQAMAKAAAGDLADALAIEQRASALDPTAGLPHGGQSYVYTKMGKYRQALFEAQTAVDLAPNDPWVHRNLGYVLQRMGMCAVAIKEYQKSQSLSPAIENEINAAQCYLMMGNRAEAIKQLEALSKTHPEDYQVLVNLARVYLSAVNIDSAEEKCFAALKLRPNSYEPTYILTQAKATRSQFSEAEEYGHKLLQIDPRNPESYVLLGSIYAGRYNQPAKAASLLGLASQQVPNDGDMFFTIARYFLAAAGQYAPAAHEKSWLDLSKRALQAAIGAEPKNVDYHLALASVLERAHDAEGTYEQVKTAHRLDPDDVKITVLYNKLQASNNDLAGCFKRWCYRTR